MNRRTFLKVSAAAVVAGCASPQTGRRLPEASWQKLPRWRGFNLLEKFNVGKNTAFVESDFQWMTDWGFNFVRLPMDYRCWAKTPEAEFNEQTMKEIDQAIEWGGKYGVHVWLNFHRAPGYTVAKPAESRDLWTDAGIQDICARHWGTFARRYKGIPNSRVAFNLFNEPSRIETAVYREVAGKMVAAIRAEDPQRLVVADGIEWGQKPVAELVDLKIAQATRGYAPGHLTHYKASWVNSEGFPLPAWPRPMAFGVLHGPAKNELHQPIVITGPFPKAGELRLHVMSVSSRATLVVEADGQPVFTKEFVCGPGAGEWKKAIYKEQWKIYQNLYDRDYSATIPAGAKEVRLRLSGGDWMQVSEIGFQQAGGREDVLGLTTEYGKVPVPIRYRPDNATGPFQTDQMEDRQWLWDKMIEPWKKLKEQGVGVMVGEWGAFSHTPHDVTLRWMRDCLTNWKMAGFGWALWNFRGSFGILDSNRKDVAYEDFQGHKLDRKMLELLQAF
ncbi:MAG: glycoside hydrolase family 5 protein [Verrucomicrobia bacterium]|nr:glycoside hydrolase family 5 protein [Verrucomicrobiota bacterium]